MEITQHAHVLDGGSIIFYTSDDTKYKLDLSATSRKLGNSSYGQLVDSDRNVISESKILDILTTYMIENNLIEYYYKKRRID